MSTHRPDSTASPADRQPPEPADLLTEGLLPKFLRYVRIDTQSDPRGAEVPTTPGQWDLSRLLAHELRAAGLSEVAIDAHGIVTATLPAAPAYETAPTLGLLAHVDTSPAVSGRGVQPVVHRDYHGGPLRLPGGVTVEPGEGVIGHDIVTSDGTTLLGADDKAGVADVMEALCRLRRDPSLPHGRVRVAFTTDEETGRGVAHLDIAAFGAEAAYTLDGGAPPFIEAETFHAKNLRVRIEGRASHTAVARGRMVNAVHLAALFIAQLPAAERPETTDGRLGFYHVDEIRGSAEAVELVVLLRDFARDGLIRRESVVRSLLDTLAAAHPGCRATYEVTGGYENMGDYLQNRPEVVRRALDAVRAAGLPPRLEPVRGGTDGSQLTARGLPTPNIFAGGVDFHSRTEWASLQWMEQAVQVVLQLVRIWAEAGA